MRIGGAASRWYSLLLWIFLWMIWDRAAKALTLCILMNMTLSPFTSLSIFHPSLSISTSLCPSLSPCPFKVTLRRSEQDSY